MLGKRDEFWNVMKQINLCKRVRIVQGHSQVCSLIFMIYVNCLQFTLHKNINQIWLKHNEISWMVHDEEEWYEIIFPPSNNS